MLPKREKKAEKAEKFNLKLETPEKDPMVHQRMMYVNTYLNSCDRELKTAKNAAERDRIVQYYLPQIKSEYARAIVESIVSGSCGDEFVFKPQLRGHSLEDYEFTIMVDALWKKSHNSKGCPKGLVFNFPVNRVTDASLSHLSMIMKHHNFAHGVVIDLSQATRITDTGLKELITALDEIAEQKQPTGGMSLSLILPDDPNLLLLKELNAKLERNQNDYADLLREQKEAKEKPRSAAAKPKAAVAKTGEHSPKARKPAAAEPKTAKSRSSIGGLYKRKPAKAKEEAKAKKADDTKYKALK